MRINLLIIVSLLLLISCRDQNAEKQLSSQAFNDQSISAPALSNDSLNSCGLINKSTIWQVKIRDGDKNEYLIKGDSMQFIDINVTTVINELNKHNNVKIKFIKKRKDTLYVRILNNKYFTQNIGDTGTDWYMASVVYSLTEIPNVKNIYFEFEKGDHGGIPGLKNRNDFLSNYMICQ